MQNPAPPESVLIESARNDARLSVRAASRRAGISEGWWRQIAKGYQTLSGGGFGPVRGPAETVAKMARAVGVTPGQLRKEGERPDAADELESLNAQPAPPPVPVAQPGFPPVPDADDEAIAPYEQQVRAEILQAMDKYGLDVTGAQVFPGSSVEQATWDTPQLRTREEKVRLIAKLRMIIDGAGQNRETG